MVETMDRIRDLPRSCSLIHITAIAKTNVMLNILSFSLGKLNTKIISQITEVLHNASFCLTQLSNMSAPGLVAFLGSSPPGSVSRTQTPSILWLCPPLCPWSPFHSANDWEKKGKDLV